MNLNVSDISSMLLQAEPSTAIGISNVVASEWGTGSTDFKDNLEHAMGQLEETSKGNCQTHIKSAEQNAPSEQVVADVRNALFSNAHNGGAMRDGINRHADVDRGKILADVEKILLKLVGGDLKAATVSPQGLDSLRELLIAAGFNAEAVDEIMTGLKEKANGKGISLDTVMDALSPLKEPQVQETDEDEADVYLATSALAFLTTMIEQLGLPKDEARQIIETADEGQNGINLSHIFRSLSLIESQANQADIRITVANEGGQLTKGLASLNMTLPETHGTDSVSLKDLLAAFDAYIQSKSAIKTDPKINAQASTSAPQQDSHTLMSQAPMAKDALVNRFVQSLSVDDIPLGQSPENSYHQVKLGLKNDMMISDKGQKGKSALFSKGLAEDETMVKTMASVLSKSEGSLSADSEHTRLGHDGKTEMKSHGDILNSSPAIGRSGSLENNMFSADKPKASERSLPSYVTQQVNKSIVRAVNNGESSLKIQLKPAALGRLTLTIDNTGNSIKVSILTEHQSARDMLTANVGELRTTLQSSGISLDSFDVNMGSEFKQSMADAGNQAGQFGRRNKKQSGALGVGSGNLSGEDLPASDGPVSGTPSNGTYHFVA